MDNFTDDELQLINQVLEENKDKIDINIRNESFDQIKEKREEALFCVFQNYLGSQQNRNNLAHYLNNLNEYEYVDDVNTINIGDIVRHVLFDDLDNIRLHKGAQVAKLSANKNDGMVQEHLLLMRSLGDSKKKLPFWCLRKDSVLFRKLTSDDKIKTSINELISDFLDD